jgi:PKD repeat protein
MADLNAQFSSSIRSGIAPLNVNFINSSTGPFTSVIWNFGDGTTSTQINPSHQFTSDGTFAVELIVLDESGNQSSSRTFITVFPEGAETESTTQRGLYTSKRFSPGQIQIRPTTTMGSTFETMMPYSGAADINTSANGVYRLNLVGYGFTDLAPLADGYTLISASTLSTDYSSYTGFANNGAAANAAYDLGEAWEGYIMCALGGPTGDTSPDSFDTLFDYSSDPKPVSIFKVYKIGDSLSDGSATLYLNKTASTLWNTSAVDPNGLISSLLLITYTGTNETTSGLSTFNNSHYQWMKTHQGIDSYTDFELHSNGGITNIDLSHCGPLNYYGLNFDSGQTASFVGTDYSGYQASDKWAPGTIFLGYPWVMWHKSTTPGIKMYDIAGSVERDENTGQRFKYLRDGTNTTDNIVGKVFYDKKMVVITDQELNSVMNIAANRNWTLPTPRLTSAGGSGDNTTAATYYVTYSWRDTGTTLSDTNLGYEQLGTLHCKDVRTFTPSFDGEKIRLQVEDSPWMAEDYSIGTGFAHNELWVIIGSGSTDSTHADADSWYYSAFTNTSLSDGLVIPDYSAFKAYNATYETWDIESDNAYSPIFSHEVGLGYMSGNFETTIYKMAATCVATNQEFNATQNPSYDDRPTGRDSTYITEVALYNENNDLLMIGKLNKPIEKDETKYITIRMEIDL